MSQRVPCPGCGHKNTPRAVYCNDCGTVLPIICPQCGQANPRVQVRCEACRQELSGQPFVPTRTDVAQADDTKGRRRLGGVLMLVGTLLFMLCAPPAVIVFIVRPPNQPVSYLGITFDSPDMMLGVFGFATLIASCMLSIGSMMVKRKHD